MNKFFLIISKDLKSYSASGSKIVMPIVYFLLILIFFSISIQNTLLDKYLVIMPQIIWLSCLLVSLLSIEALYKDDYDDGTLEFFVINSELLEVNILAKIIGYWLANILPLILIGCLMNIILTSNVTVSIVLFLSLIIGTLCISLIGSIAAALTVGIKSNNLLLSTIVLPLDIPVLIFGTSCVYNAHLGLSYTSEILLLVILMILFLLIAPYASSLGLRNSLD